MEDLVRHALIHVEERKFPFEINLADLFGGYARSFAYQADDRALLELVQAADIDEEAAGFARGFARKASVGLFRVGLSFFDFDVDVFGVSVVIEKAVELGGHQSADQFLLAQAGKGGEHRGEVRVDLLLVDIHGNQFFPPLRRVAFRTRLGRRGFF